VQGIHLGRSVGGPEADSRSDMESVQIRSGIELKRDNKMPEKTMQELIAEGIAAAMPTAIASAVPLFVEGVKQTRNGAGRTKAKVKDIPTGNFFLFEASGTKETHIGVHLSLYDRKCKEITGTIFLDVSAMCSKLVPYTVSTWD